MSELHLGAQSPAGWHTIIIGEGRGWAVGVMFDGARQRAAEDDDWEVAQGGNVVLYPGNPASLSPFCPFMVNLALTYFGPNRAMMREGIYLFFLGGMQFLLLFLLSLIHMSCFVLTIWTS